MRPLFTKKEQEVIDKLLSGEWILVGGSCFTVETPYPIPNWHRGRWVPHKTSLYKCNHPDDMNQAKETIYYISRAVNSLFRKGLLIPHTHGMFFVWWKLNHQT